MVNDRDSYTPLVLFEYEHNPGNYCLMLSDQHMVQVTEVFERLGQYGNGYDWEAVARQVVRARGNELEGRFKYDPEAGTFVAYGQDLDALRELGQELKRAFDDSDLLAGLIRDADPDWFD